MKKKLILATAIVLLLAIGLTMLVGCDEIFTRNDMRDMTQVVARVHYGNETADIYKYELRSSFSSYAYYYVNYYGMSAESAARYILQSLAQQKLLVLYAREQVAKLENKTNPDGTIPATKELLNEAEQNKAVKDANDSMLSSLKTLIQNAITEDNYNNATNEGSADKTEDEDDDEEITEPVIVRFESNGGTEIERQRIQKGKKATEPDDPTKDGYTFYGWYADKEYAESDAFDLEATEYDFDSAVNDSLTLYAKWAKYDAPRTALPEEEEEEEEFDPDEPLKDEDRVTPFIEWDDAKLYDEIKEEDFVEKITLDEGEELEPVLKKYIGDALSTLKKNLRTNLYKNGNDEQKDYEECWEYYLNNQYESLIVDRFERVLCADLTATEEEIQAEFDRVVANNKESFELSDTAYSSALTGSLDSTYYHQMEELEGSYGFVTNILLRLDDEQLNKLTAQLNANPANKEAVRVLRNKYLSELTVKVSNPKYDADAKVEKDDEEIELRDPMTDPKNPYNPSGKTSDYDHSYQFKKSGDGDTAVYENNYNEILSFGKKLGEDGNPTDEYEIKFQATEHPAMAYLLEKVHAFDKDGKTGIIHQIYNSFKKVQDVCAADGLDRLTEVYWLRKMASTWAYLVGDDTGAVTSSSNNNGLGYLISPEGETSSYLPDFTDYARKLIAAGTGSYALGEINPETDFLGAQDATGELAGNNKAYVVADSFIESGSTSNAYAGIFVLLNTYTVWDSELYKSYSENDLPSDDYTLPLDFIYDITLKQEDRKTLSELIKDNLETAKKTNYYNVNVNTMGNEHMEDDIEYFEKAYKSIWKDYD